MSLQYKKIGIISSNSTQAIARKRSLIKQYGLIDLPITKFDTKLAKIDLIIALGGDGLMLHLLHQIAKNPVPIYGINFGTVGFLMNANCDENLLYLISKSEPSVIKPLKMIATNVDGEKHQFLAINEVSLLRQKNQAANIQISINNTTRIENLSADGILVATSAGSTAYNLSVRGPIIPFDSKIIALTPISPFRPRHWHGALLPENSKIKFTILDYKNRPVSATADYNEVRNVKEVEVTKDTKHQFTILFDVNHSLEERIVREQFL